MNNSNGVVRSVSWMAVSLLAIAAPIRESRAKSGPEDLPTADQIVARYIDARGGDTKIRSVRTVIYRGVYSEGDFVAPEAAMALMRPYYKLVGDPDKLSSQFREGYDGSAWEYYGDPGIVVRTVGPAAAAARHGLAIDGPLVDYRQKGTTITVLGIEPVAGRAAYRMLVRMRDGFEEEEFVDTDTALLVAERKVAPVHAFGKAIASETHFGDYRPVQEVQFAHSNREVEIASGKVLNEMKWTSITVNQEIDPAAFSPPVFTRTPLQRLLDQLYMERADVQAVLWSYHEFRRAHPAIETDEGIQVIGYQILKMGDHASAVALLKANVSDYPRSSGAALALGRAHQTAGNLSESRVEFRRALSLDPGNKRAAEALRNLPD